MLNIHKLDELLNGFFEGGRPAKRTYQLIATIPQGNRDQDLSRERSPEWLNDETGERVDNEIEFANAMAGSRMRE